MLKWKICLAAFFLPNLVGGTFGQFSPRMQRENSATRPFPETGVRRIVEPASTLKIASQDYGGSGRVGNFETLDNLAFHEGLAACLVKEKGGHGVKEKWAYIDKSGRIVIPPQFDFATRFNEQLAAVRIGSKYGYIDKNGAFIITPQYAIAEKFADGLAPVRLDHAGKFGYIDRRGNMIIPPRFSLAAPFSEGVAMVVFQPWKESGFIDKTGTLIIKPGRDRSRSLIFGWRFANRNAANISGILDTAIALRVEP